jgi:hypothetical protein
MQTTAADKVPETPSWPNLDAGLWGAIGTSLWVLLGIILVVLFRKQIIDLFRALVLRVKTGAALKIFSIEFGAIRVSPNALPSNGSIAAHQDPTGQWAKRREGVYGDNHLLFIAHRLFPSEIPGQLYDVLVYLIPHRARGQTLRGIERVEYYFGASWGDRVFSTSDSGNRFGIVVAAYGTGFLCLAKVFFRDGQTIDAWRYIDFEMGPLGDGGESVDSAA